MDVTDLKCSCHVNNLGDIEQAWEDRKEGRIAYYSVFNYLPIYYLGNTFHQR